MIGLQVLISNLHSTQQAYFPDKKIKYINKRMHDRAHWVI